MFKGSMVAIITPFRADGSVDEEAFRQLVEFQIENGTDVLVPCGTTGESATLSYEEHDQVIRACIEQARGRVPVVAGTGSNSTAEAIEISRHAKEMGADGLLLVSPYYNKPSQEGLYQHYKAIAEAVALPQILYNVPGRTGMNMQAATTIRLAEISNIVAIKEASGDVTQAGEILSKAGDKIDVLSGDDFLTLPLMAIGAKGVISVTANIMPKQVKAMVSAIEAGRWDEARALHLKMLDIHNAMFIESNPVPVKTAAALLGRCGDQVRLPLVSLQSASLEKLKQVMGRYELL
ncbi:4-hydroxy-tetrahydrodipicolinate synthase [Desulfuromonas thiophila]|jgi:4-hydroxy-tetrahydrodipicolinate synthase|uniref:4-hydroxy-tetrahydrodipicolinate synthase n=1 Tax=Desulfuromonas thiophila TaxID=57664 RepID=A0A1G6ZPA9_9BACT|nr:4-hydroxy-tetrahydrodipicolinate synthase [Desulfuromonas thiophila]MDY0397797.1 4-hydroxy-tetrahydrodipicolinate synthase [Desulfuromonas thiophila]SDE04223.1 dihydrodipicolinate synthase [Desulfuromonas thiophila]